MAPVYIDGEKAVTLKGERIAEQFQTLVDEYVARRFGATTSQNERTESETEISD